MKEVVIRFKNSQRMLFFLVFSFPDDACFDLFSPIDTIIVPQESKIIDLEIASEFPRGYEVVCDLEAEWGLTMV